MKLCILKNRQLQKKNQNLSKSFTQEPIREITKIFMLNRAEEKRKKIKP